MKKGGLAGWVTSNFTWVWAYVEHLLSRSLHVPKHASFLIYDLPNIIY